MSDIGPVGPVLAGGELPLPVGDEALAAGACELLLVVDEALAAGADELLLVVDESLAAGAGELLAWLVTERVEERSDAALVERWGCETGRRRGA